MNARGRIGFGGLFVVVGVVAWTWLLWAYEPVGRPSAQLPPAIFGPTGISLWLSSGRALRLSALVLGVGGLLITARMWRRGAGLALALGAAWVGADFGLDIVDVESVVTVAVAGLTVAAAAAAIMVASVRRGETSGAGRAWWLLVYAGVAVGVATPGFSLNGSHPPLGQLLVFAAVLASALVAGAAVNPDRTPVTGWRLAAVPVALAVALYLRRYFGWGSAAATGFDRSSFWWREALVVAAVLFSPLVAAAAVALTGALRGRRAGVALPAVVLALLPASLANTLPVLSWLAPLVGRGSGVEAADGHRYLPGQLIAGALLGISAIVLARLAPVLFATSARSTAAPRAVARRWATAVGLVLAAVGVASWAVAQAVVTPAARAVDQGQPISIHITAPLFGWSANLRWAAILLAWCGLRLAARTRGRARWLVAGVLVWFAADVAFTVIGVRGWLAASICAAVAGGGLVVVALTRAPVPDVPAGSAGYAAAAAGAGIQMMAIRAWMLQYLPGWAFQLGLAVSLLLVVAAVVHTLMATAIGRAGRLAAAVVATAGIAGAVLHYATARNETDRAGETWVYLTLLAAVALAATACALSSGGGIRRRWPAVATAVVAVVIGALPLYVATGRLAVLPQDLEFGLDGMLGLVSEWYNDTVAGAVLGLSLAMLALLPRALSTPDSPLATEPPPEHLLPPERTVPSAPARVPDVLSWPPEPDEVPAR